MNEENKTAYSVDAIKARLLEADCPSAILDATSTKLQNLTPFAQKVFASWFESGSLSDGAFNIAGVTPRTIRAVSPKINDIGIILTCDHLVRQVAKECEVIFGKGKRMCEAERKLSLQMMKSKWKQFGFVLHQRNFDIQTKENRE